MRKKMVAGNWKMHGSRSSSASLIEGIKQGAKLFSSKIDILLLPSFVHLQLAEHLLADTRIGWGAQNHYIGAQGAFTGEISAPMLVDYGCQYVLVGHSERRQVFGEDLNLVAAKFKNALEFGLKPILCIGETLAEREKGQTETILTQQLQSVLALSPIDSFRHAVIAYEPVWAIGTGLTATPEQAQAAHAFIRQELAQSNSDVANSMQILYGGSVKADNAAGLLSMPDIDGGLIGGASLDVKSFLAICEAGVSVCTS